MKYLIMILFASLTLNLFAGDVTYIQIAMPANRLADESTVTNITAVLCELYGWDDPTPAQETWAFTGWNSLFCSEANTNITVAVYRQSVRNLKKDMINTLTQADKLAYLVRLKNGDALIKGSCNTTPDESLEQWGVIKK